MNINEYLKNHPRSCKFGAPMGDSPWRGDPDAPHKFWLQRLRFTDGCYALDGTYWGGPANVFCAWAVTDDDEPVRMFVRGYCRDVAKAAVLEEYPRARFCR